MLLFADVTCSVFVISLCRQKKLFLMNETVEVGNDSKKRIV